VITCCYYIYLYLFLGIYISIRVVVSSSSSVYVCDVCVCVIYCTYTRTPCSSIHLGDPIHVTFVFGFLCFLGRYTQANGVRETTEL